MKRSGWQDCLNEDSMQREATGGPVVETSMIRAYDEGNVWVGPRMPMKKNIRWANIGGGAAKIKIMKNQAKVKGGD